MTADESRSLREDIAYMKVLADEGMSTPLVGGPILMLFGGVFSVLNLVAWWVGNMNKGVNGDQLFWFNVAAFVLCGVGLPLLIRRASKQPGFRSPANRAFGMAWASVGWAIFVMMLVVYLACRKVNSGLPAMIMGPAVICLYAVGWTVAAAMTRQRFLWVAAIGSYLAAFVPILVWNDHNAGLYVGAIIFLIAFVPGTILFLREPKSVI